MVTASFSFNTIKLLYCYKEKIGLRRHSNKEILWVPESYKLKTSRYPEQDIEVWWHYYASAERGDDKAKQEDVIVYEDSFGHYIGTCTKGKYKAGDDIGLSRTALVVLPYDDVESIYIREEINPKDYQEWFLDKLNGESPILIREYYPEACYLVTRSYQPSDKIPWKRVGRRSYIWLVSLEERDANKGRRIEWGGDTILFANRRAALKHLYSN